MTLLVSVQAQVSLAGPSKRRNLFYCVHYYKDAMLGRFYAICNCCSCCCGAMQAHQHGTPMPASYDCLGTVQNRDSRSLYLSKLELCSLSLRSWVVGDGSGTHHHS